MKTSVYLMILLAVLVVVPIISNVVMAQAGFDRETCLQSCGLGRPSPLSQPSPSPWGVNRSAWSNYYIKCVNKCESQFSSEIGRNTERLERKLHEPN